MIIDDEKNIRTTLAVCLEGMGCQVEGVASGGAALEALACASFDMAFLDLRLGAESGLDLIPRLLIENPNLAIIVITAYATFETAVEAMRRGAKDYVPKPFTPAQIRQVVEQLAQQCELAHRVTNLENQLRESVPEADFETASPLMKAALD